MTATPEATTEPSQAARVRQGWREQKLAIKVAGVVATMPTILAAQGMITVTTDVLHSPLWMALLLSGFLEGGLVAFALLARDAAVHGLPPAVDSAAVWALSVLSGLLSASHELIGPLADGTRGWTFTAPQLEAAAVRMIVPLVAALIWERVLVHTKREAAARTAAEVRLDRRCLAFGRSVQLVRRLDTGAAPGHVRRLRQWSARRRFDRQHVALLRRMPATDTGLRLRTMAWVAEVAGADNLYLSIALSDTLVGGPDTRGVQVPAVLALSDTSAALSDTKDGDLSGAVHVSDTLSDTSAVPTTRSSLGLVHHICGLNPGPVRLSDTSAVLSDRADTGLDTLDGDLAGPVRLSDALSDTSVVQAGGPGTGSDTLDGDASGAVHLSDTLSDTSGAVSDTSAGAVVVPDPLTIAVELVRDNRRVAGSRIAAAMRRHGHPVTDRTGLRWRDRAVDHLDAELTKDLSDTNNAEVRLALAAV